MPFTDANLLGLSPEKSPSENRAILQSALDRGGTVVISEPGIYEIDGTLFIGSYTTLEFANGAALKKTGSFTHAILNRGALTKSWDEHIIVRGAKIIVDNVTGEILVPGLRGQLAFFYVRDLTLDDIRIPDLEPDNFGIHICTFEDVTITNCIIEGKKDGIHLGRGRRFYIGNCKFNTYDDAIALNGHDYDSSNPQLGFIEDGVIEKCYDLTDPHSVGYFCRILAGAWVDWYEGMEVQKSDSVVSEGRLYRVFAKPDKKKYISTTRPTHKEGHQILDGIDWVMVQDEPVYDAGVRNVTFRDIFLYKPRTSFSVHFDHDHWSRSFYPGAKNPLQEQLFFENVHVLHDGGNDFLSIATPIDSMTLRGCSLRNNRIIFGNPARLADTGTTKLTLSDCSAASGNLPELIRNGVPGKRVELTIDGKSVII